MKNQTYTRDIKLVPIGNSKGVLIPRLLLQKYGFNQSIVLEETDEGLLLRKRDDEKLSWKDTYKAMADEQEDWNDFNIAIVDGLDDEEVEF
ncbi:MAG: AbrB/MazE/SpoVT family DNA-binding domain-containing protein [Desulfamplus sp.]|nr:AbrB/MazE/SpoVT family DNA-binding domain-containing protein [Desulfamplus sp.]